MRQLSVLIVFLSTLLLSGCNRDAQTEDQREEKTPLIKQGLAYMEIKDWNKAEETFKKAINKNPRLATPHLQLATIYQQHKPNLIFAIYHYQRYLELRPESEKKEFIQEQLQRIQNTLVESIVKQDPKIRQIMENYQKLQEDNISLRRQIASLEKQLTTVKQQKEENTTQPSFNSGIKSTANQTRKSELKGSVKVTANTQTYTIYHVVSGDTLSRIAAKFYGNSSKWDIIYNANKESMRSPGDLRVGQTLIIPKLEN